MSGLLAGFLGGIAKGGLDIINTEEAQQRKIEDEARREEATMRAEERRALAETKRQETLEAFRLARQEADRKRDASDMIGASEDAEKAVSDRGFEKFKSDLGQTDASPEELRKVYDSQYHDKTVGGFQGADRYDVKESEKAKERLTQLQRRGASSGLISSGYTDYKDTANRERQAEVDAFNVRKQETKEAGDKAEAERKERLTDAQIAKLAGGGSSGPNNVTREERIRYTSLLTETSRRITEAQKARSTLIKEGGSKKRMAPELEAIDAEIAALQEDRKLYQGMLSQSQTGQPGASERPSGGAASPASAGRPDATETDEQRSGRISTIQREFAQAVGRGDIATADGLQRELERLSDPKPAGAKVNQNDGQSSKRKPPAISSVKGAPAGSSFGSYVEGKGWEVRVNGKLVGYAKDKD